MDYLDGDNNRMYTDSCYFWKAPDRFIWRDNFQEAVLFAVSFFASSFYILLLSTIMNYDTLSEVSYITELKSGFFLVVASFTNLTLFCSIIFIYPLFISWIGLTVSFITA